MANQRLDDSSRIQKLRVLWHRVLLLSKEFILNETSSGRSVSCGEGLHTMHVYCKVMLHLCIQEDRRARSRPFPLLISLSDRISGLSALNEVDFFFRMKTRYCGEDSLSSCAPQLSYYLLPMRLVRLHSQVETVRQAASKALVVLGTDVSAVLVVALDGICQRVNGVLNNNRPSLAVRTQLLELLVRLRWYLEYDRRVSDSMTSGDRWLTISIYTINPSRRGVMHYVPATMTWR